MDLNGQNLNGITDVILFSPRSSLALERVMMIVARRKWRLFFQRVSCWDHFDWWISRNGLANRRLSKEPQGPNILRLQRISTCCEARRGASACKEHR